MGKKSLNYTKCAVICHGKSEFQIAKFIKSNLHLKMAIFATDYDVELNKNQLMNFKLFVIMDTDDCTNLQKENFMNKKMFNKHPLSNYIFPIVNIPNLENVLIQSHIAVKKRDKGE